MNRKRKILSSVFILFLVIVILCTIAVGYTIKIGWLPVRVFSSAEEGEIKIACVGDSITYGAGVYDWLENAYPVVLNNLLGRDYVVNNYGYSGRTALYDGDMPYIKDKVYQKSLDFLPDIVVIMFGTNDSKPINWKGKDAFKKDYAGLIDSYLALPSSPEIYILAPPPAFAFNGIIKFTINGSLIDGEIHQAVLELAQEKGLRFIDMHAVFEGKEEYFPDGIHPNKEGAKIFAYTVYEAIMNMQ
jgi:lysophospholipase L1-like esterase